MHLPIHGSLIGLAVAVSLVAPAGAFAEPPATKTAGEFATDPATLPAGDPCADGYRALTRRDFDSALTSFDAVLASDARNARAHRLRGVALTYLVRYNEAQSALDARLALQDDAKIRDARGFLCWRRSDLIGAEREFEASVRADPANQTARRNLLRLRQYRGDLDGAERVLRDFVAASGRSATTLLFEASLKLDRGLVNDARLLLKEATCLYPKDAEAWRWRGRAALREAHVADAIGYFTKAVELLPCDAELWDFLGTSHYYLGAFEEADAALTKAIACDPDGADLYLHRSSVRASRGEYQAAFQDADESLRLAPSKDLARRWHACLWLYVGDAGAAKDELEQLLSARPADAEAAALLCLAYFWQGAPRRGTEAVRNCCARGGDGAALAAGLALCLAADGEPMAACRAVYRGARAFPGAATAMGQVFLRYALQEKRRLHVLIKRREWSKLLERVGEWPNDVAPFTYLLFDFSQLVAVNCRQSL